MSQSQSPGADSPGTESPRVEIYTKWGCPYCYRAKTLLEDKLEHSGATLAEYDITMGGPQRAEMLERAPGSSTVPQIFINGQHIGGCDDLLALDRRGGLDPLLGR